MLLLPAMTAPPDEVFARRHTPAPIDKKYAVFRDCLRWEFGFTCAICLLHERDILGWGGVEKWGVMHIEHVVPRSHDPRGIGTYANLLYICRLCNGARSDTDPEDGHGRRLLDPTRDIWSRHFTVADDRLHFARTDHDAEYTAEVYNINDARKVRLRRARRELVHGLLAATTSEHDELARLTGTLPRASPTDLTAAISHLERRLAQLHRRWTAESWIPEDAPDECRCGRHEARTLPPAYARQCVRMTAP